MVLGANANAYPDRIVRGGPRPRLLLTAAVFVHCVSFANAAMAGDPQSPATAPAGAAALTSCNLPGVAQPARCGAFDRPENPNRPDGRRIPVGVAVIPAAGDKALPDPIVVLMGGPGEEAISAAAVFAERFASLLQERDLLLVDQRGTGRSGALRCDLSSTEDPAANLRDFLPLAAVKRCEQQLREQADLTQYSYAHFANDLEHVRRALGYGPLNLSAGSYGTRAAQVYLRAYPQSVRTAYLGSVVPIDLAIPLPLANAAQTAFEKTFAACAADSACHAAFPNLRDEFRQVLARLESGVRVDVPGGGVASLHRGRVVEWFRALLYRAESAATAPWMIHQAYIGNWNPIVEGILSSAGARSTRSDVSFGLFFSISLQRGHSRSCARRTSRLQRRARSWETIACVSSRPRAGIGRRFRSRRIIGSQCAHLYRPCSFPAIRTLPRRSGLRSTLLPASLSAPKWCSAIRGTRSGTPASHDCTSGSCAAAPCVDSTRPASPYRGRHSGRGS